MPNAPCSVGAEWINDLGGFIEEALLAIRAQRAAARGRRGVVAEAPQSGTSGLRRAVHMAHMARQYWRFNRLFAGPGIMRAFAAAHSVPYFIEIGANDGLEFDKLKRFILGCGWPGIMVEPVPWIFERLTSNYGRFSRLILENAAVAEDDGRLPFYYLDPVSDPAAEGLPDWYHGIGSFLRSAVVSYADRIPDIEERIRVTEVPCLTFDSLCRKHRVGHVDALVLDTEGYDWKILQTIDFCVWHPRLVLYEHWHLRPEEQAECRQRMHAFGYETMEEALDTYCVDTSMADQLTRAWRSMPDPYPPAFAHSDSRRSAAARAPSQE